MYTLLHFCLYLIAPAHHGGQTRRNTRPLTMAMGTGPYCLESVELSLLSPSSQTCPLGTRVPQGALSPANAATRLHTVCFGFCMDVATTTSPFRMPWNLDTRRSRSTTSPSGFKVGTMLGPMHCARPCIDTSARFFPPSCRVWLLRFLEPPHQRDFQHVFVEEMHGTGELRQCLSSLPELSQESACRHVRACALRRRCDVGRSLRVTCTKDDVKRAKVNHRWLCTCRDSNSGPPAY